MFSYRWRYPPWVQMVMGVVVVGVGNLLLRLIGYGVIVGVEFDVFEVG